MEIYALPGSHPSEPVRTRPDQFGDWLTVSKAAAYCSLMELDRTPKTIRKWAHRSHRDPESAELTVRREDVDNGFRWTIERASLDRKIAQELEFEARRAGEPVETRPDAFGAVQTGAVSENDDDRSENPSEPVQTGAHPSEPVREPMRLSPKMLPVCFRLIPATLYIFAKSLKRLVGERGLEPRTR